MIGLDPIADTDLTRHKKLFAEKDIVNIENLKNLQKQEALFPDKPAYPPESYVSGQ